MRFIKTITGSVLYLFFLSHFSFAGTAATPPPPGSPASSAVSQATGPSTGGASSTSTDEGQIIKIVISGVSGEKPSVSLGDIVNVYVDNVPSATDGKEVLYLNGMEITGLVPQSKAVRSDQSGLYCLKYLLEITPSSRAAWASLIANSNHLSMKIALSIGSPGGHPIKSPYTDENPIDFVILKTWQIVAGLTLWVSVIVLFFVINYGARRWWKSKGLLRDQSEPYNSDPPYSLSRVQMAWWLFIILISFITITLITGDEAAFSNTAFILMGITTFTQAGAKIIEGQKLAAATAAGTQPPQLGQSVGFLPDILSDNTGMSISRFQVFVWTLVLGIIFLAQVYQGLLMPELSAQYLTLMGITSGTYLGFKIAE